MSAMAPICADFAPRATSDSPAERQQRQPMAMPPTTPPQESSTKNTLNNAHLSGSSGPGITKLEPTMPTDMEEPKVDSSDSSQLQPKDIKVEHVEQYKEKRGRLKEKRALRRRKHADKFKGDMTHLYFLHNYANIMELLAFYKKLPRAYLTFLKDNRCPSDILAEVHENVGGPAPTPPSPASSNERLTPLSSQTPSLGTLTGVKHKLAPPSLLKSHPDKVNNHRNRAAERTSNNLSIFFKNLKRQQEQKSSPGNITISAGTMAKIGEKIKQEAWVIKRVNELTKEGKWALKRMPKVCERSRGRSQWDFMMQEMQWLSVDFYQERQWKKAAAKMIAYSAKMFVEKWEEVKKKRLEEKEKRLRLTASFIANEVRSFWSETWQLNVGIALGKKVSSVPKLNHSESGDMQETIEQNGIGSDSSEDESTISEQERYEQRDYTDTLKELKQLAYDLTEPIESLLPPHYPASEPCQIESSDDSDIDQDADDSLSVTSSENWGSDNAKDLSDSEESNDEDLLNLKDNLVTREETICVNSSSRQQKLYDDYFVKLSVQNKTGEGKSPADVQQLRRSCRSQEQQIQQDGKFPISFPRVADTHYHRLFRTMLDYDPFRNFDLVSLNMVFLAHESLLTAITSNRMGKFCASKKLIEELPERVKILQQTPLPPPGRIALEFMHLNPSRGNITVTGKVVSRQSSIEKERKLSDVKPTQSFAFHKESLNTIAQFNERRCKGLPLYGEDLIAALTVVDNVRPTRTRFKGMSYVNCLNAGSLRRKNNHNLKRKDWKDDSKLKTNTLNELVTISSRYFASYLDRPMVQKVSIPQTLSLVQKWSKTISCVQDKLMPTLAEVADQHCVPLALQHQNEDFKQDLYSKLKCKTNTATVAFLGKNGDRSASITSDDEDESSLETNLKPIHWYGIDYLDSDGLSLEELTRFDYSPDLNQDVLQWESHFQNKLSKLDEEVELLDTLPNLTYSYEDSVRPWHGIDGQPMPLWLPPSGSYINEVDLIDHYLSFLYKTDVMTNEELPPIYIKKEVGGTAGPTQIGLKRTAAEAGFDQVEVQPGPNTFVKPATQNVTQMVINNSGAVEVKTKIRKEESNSSSMAPRSLFERSMPSQFKRREKFQQRMRQVPTPGSIVAGALNATATVAGIRHPLPRPQVEAENAPKWIVSEDWALLKAVREILELPLNLATNSPGHVVNWDLVSDMVNAVSKVYRGPRQCRARYESIIVPREEGRILYDVTPTVPHPMNNKNKKKTPKAIFKTLTPNKAQKALKTSQLFSNDNNSEWSHFYSNRFEQINTFASKRTPTTKPLLVNPVHRNLKHATVLQDSGISYETPLNPVRVAANRADRIQKEKQRNQQDQQQLVQQQRAQSAANQAQQLAAAQSAGIIRNTVAVAGSSGHIIQQPAIVATSGANTAQAVVVGISQASTATTQQVIVQGSPSALNRLALQPGQQVVGTMQDIASRVTSQTAASAAVPSIVVSSRSNVVSVANLSQSQLQAAQKLVNQSGPIQRSIVTAQGRPLMQSQIKLLKQQSLVRRNADPATALKVRQGSIQGGTTVVGTTTNTGQKVSIAVKPGGSIAAVPVSTAANLANLGAVTVVTQALHGQPRAQLIRQLAGGKANIIAGSSGHIIQQPAIVASSGANTAQAVVVGISQASTATTQQVIVQGSPSALNKLALQPGQQVVGTVQDIASRVTSQAAASAAVPSIVVPSRSNVVSVANLSQSQLQAAQKLVNQSGSIQRSIVTAQGRPLTQSQINLLKQQSLARRNADPATALKVRQGSIQGGATVVGTTTNTGQKVSIAVTPGGSIAAVPVSTSASLANLGAVTVVTQALQGQPRAQLIRQIAGGKANINLQK